MRRYPIGSRDGFCFQYNILVSVIKNKICVILTLIVIYIFKNKISFFSTANNNPEAIIEYLRTEPKTTRTLYNCGTRYGYIDLTASSKELCFITIKNYRRNSTYHVGAYNTGSLFNIFIKDNAIHLITFDPSSIFDRDSLGVMLQCCFIDIAFAIS